MATEWYLKSFDDEYGPIPFADLVELVRNGTVVESDLLRPTTSSELQRAESVIGLFYMASRPASKPAPKPDSHQPIAPIPTEPDTLVSDSAGKDTPPKAAIDHRPEWLIRLLDARDQQLSGSGRDSVPRTLKSQSRIGEPGNVTDPANRATIESEEGHGFNLENSDDSDAAFAEAIIQSTSDRAQGRPLGLSGSSSEWARTVDEALGTPRNTVSTRTSAVLKKKQFQWVFAAFRGLSRTIQNLGGGQAVAGMAYRLACGLACAVIVTYSISSWSEREALRFPSRDAITLRSVPIIGPCSPDEFWFWTIDAALGAGCLGFWGASLLVFKIEN